ncbi:MAG: uroporphyrinogen decarboxylase family protein [Candidatus Bathyarchaeia archaeon]
MKRRDNVLAALRHEEPDWIPYNEGFTDGDAQRKFGDRLLFDNDFRGAGVGVGRTEILESSDRLVVYKTWSGAVWEMHYGPYWHRIRKPALERLEDMDSVELPDVWSLPVRQVREARSSCERQKAEGYYVQAGVTEGPFPIGWKFFRRLDLWLVDLIARPHLCKKLLDRLLPWVVDQAVINLEEVGVDGIGTGGDMGTTRGLFFSPKLYREMFHPWYMKLAAEVHKRDGYLNLHSHGNINAIYGDLVEAGVDVINPLDPEDGMNLRELKETYGGKMTLSGGVSRKVAFMTTPEMKRHVNEVIATAAPGGGLILDSAGRISSDMSLEFATAYVEYCGKARRAWRRIVQDPDRIL